ncbi:DUF4177 domain-containing protein [Clostridium sp. C2-6-12]|uniref:DUF4177 domain-containing protein n=1 Tax=Clostridium sp. C2-6-12 TaxID=2698832 RepID=UPI00136FCDE7|nr:DUF4177 domain-containing protein [Clostridium sp. C2-6-12]
MERWEYTSIKVETKGFMGGILEIEDFNYELNKFGEQGWELVSCLTTSLGQGTTREVVAVFKRRK